MKDSTKRIYFLVSITAISEQQETRTLCDRHTQHVMLVKCYLQPTYLLVNLSVCLFVCQSVNLSDCPSECLSVGMVNVFLRWLVDSCVCVV